MKICKVITTCFIKRNHGRGSSGWPQHPQEELNTPEEVKKMIEKQIDLENKYSAGFPLDLVIVNNDSGWSPGKEWLNSINGTKTLNGKIIILNRINLGFSFGGFSYAFDMLKDIYDYFLFSEDDMFIGGNNYITNILNKFNSDPKIGFVAMVGISDSDLPVHAHGGTGFTSKEILNQVCSKNNGYLPYTNLEGKGGDYRLMFNAEIEFTNIINRLGYKIIDYGVRKWSFEINQTIHYTGYKKL